MNSPLRTITLVLLLTGAAGWMLSAQARLMERSLTKRQHAVLDAAAAAAVAGELARSRLRLAATGRADGDTVVDTSRGPLRLSVRTVASSGGQTRVVVSALDAGGAELRRLETVLEEAR